MSRPARTILRARPRCIAPWHARLRSAAAIVGGFVLAVLYATSFAQPAREPVQPLPKQVEHDPRKAELGRQLFFDRRLSRDNTVSCASCHDPLRGGADGRQKSVGIDGKTGPVNAPTVLNAALNFRQFWDGRARSLFEQVEGPVHNPVEMGSNWPEVVRKLEADRAFRAAFVKVFPNGLRPENIRSALDHFQRTLITPGSRFDRWLTGDAGALTPVEARGYQHFKAYGCVACHQGANLGGNMFQRFGAIGDYFRDRGGVQPEDLGRYNVTKQEADRFFFKVPSLRNVELTAPYFHDGSARTLEEAVDVMFKYQLGRPAPTADRADIVAFLRTLTAETPAHFKP